MFDPWGHLVRTMTTAIGDFSGHAISSSGALQSKAAWESVK
jgi:hypothetical protein